MTIVVIGARTDGMTAVTAKRIGTNDVADRACSGRSGPAKAERPLRIVEIMRALSSIALVRAAG